MPWLKRSVCVLASVAQKLKCSPGLYITQNHTQSHTHTIPGRTPLTDWSARRRGRYPHIHTTNTTGEHPFHQQGFELAIQRIKWPRTNAIDGTDAEIGVYVLTNPLKMCESTFLCNVPRFLQDYCFLEGSQASRFCTSDKSKI